MLRVLIFSLNTILSWIMKIVLCVLLVFSMFTDIDFIVSVSIGIAIICSFLPAILNRSYEVNLPWIVDFFVTLSVFLHIIGITFNLYHIPSIGPWWDTMTHFFGSALIAMLAFFVVFTLNFVKKVKMSIPMIGFFTFVFALALGAIWEIMEFYSDQFLGTRSVIGIEDTIDDLVVDAVGGALAAFLGMLYVRRSSKKDLSKTLHPIAKILIGKDLQ